MKKLFDLFKITGQSCCLENLCCSDPGAFHHCKYNVTTEI